MESSKMLNRCIMQIARSKRHCGSSFHASHQSCLRKPRTMQRTLTTSTNKAAEPKGPVPKSSEPNNDTTNPNTSTQPNARRSRDTNRIDLSTIPGISSSYRPPNRPDEATAQAKLRTLLGAINTPREKPQPYTGPSLDAYTAPRKPAIDIASLIEDLDRPRHATNDLDEEPHEVLRLRPTLGRTFNVTPATGFDLTRAFRSLDMKCNQNSVRADEIKQRFHVRRGQRRKLNRRMRWRILFKEGFLAECARVRRMRAQGW